MVYQELQLNWQEYKDQGDIKLAKAWLCDEMLANIKHIETVFAFPYRLHLYNDVFDEIKLFKPEFDMICEKTSEFLSFLVSYASFGNYTIEDAEEWRTRLITYMRDELTYPAVYASVCRSIPDQGRELSEAISGFYDSLLLWKCDDLNDSPSLAYDKMFDQSRKEPFEVAYRLKHKYLFIKYNLTRFENDILEEYKLPFSFCGKSEEIDRICEALDKVSYYMAIVKGIIMREIPRGRKDPRHPFDTDLDRYYVPFVNAYKLYKKEYEGSPASRYGPPVDRIEVLLEMCKQELSAITSK